MTKYFGFIDETGVLQKDPNQRFFGLGLLKLAQTATLYDQLVRLKNQILADLTRLEKPFEFKFNHINRSNYRHYRRLLDIYFSFPEAAFYVFVIDKQHPDFQMDKDFKDVWEAYIAYSKKLIHMSLGNDDEICVLADYLSKPKASTSYYEVEVARPNAKEAGSVYNACMLESDAALFVQLVDVLAGCVVFDFRMKAQPDRVPNEFKRGMVELLRQKLKVGSLVGKLAVTQPNQFSVQPFEGK